VFVTINKEARCRYQQHILVRTSSLSPVPRCLLPAVLHADPGHGQRPEGLPRSCLRQERGRWQRQNDITPHTVSMYREVSWNGLNPATSWLTTLSQPWLAVTIRRVKRYLEYLLPPHDARARARKQHTTTIVQTPPRSRTLAPSGCCFLCTHVQNNNRARQSHRLNN
jgi:hypothetical protein